MLLQTLCQRPDFGKQGGDQYGLPQTFLHSGVAFQHPSEAKYPLCPLNIEESTLLSTSHTQPERTT